MQSDAHFNRPPDDLFDQVLALSACIHTASSPLEDSLAVACGHKGRMTHQLGIRQTFAALVHNPVLWGSY